MQLDHQKYNGVSQSGSQSISLSEQKDTKISISERVDAIRANCKQGNACDAGFGN